MKLNIANIVQIILISQGLFFCFFLLSQKKGKKISNWLLAGFLFVLAIHMAINIIESEWEINFPLSIIAQCLGFLYGPLFYLYVKSLAYKFFNLSQYSFKHLIPFIVRSLLALLPLNIPFYYWGIAVGVSLIFYISLAYISINKFQQVIKNTQSRYDLIALKWLKQLIYLMLVIALLDTVHNFLVYNITFLEELFFVFLMLALLLFVNTLVFKGLKQPELFQGITSEEEKIAGEIQSKYAFSTLSDDRINNLANKIEDYMKSTKPYLNADLNLQKLAEEIELNTRDCSQVINSYFNQNFSDFINSFRINDAIHMLSNSKNKSKTVLEILYEVGFKSKSNFYTAFKKRTGLTPSQYKKQLNS